MRNYYKRFGIKPTANTVELSHRMNRLEEKDPELVRQARPVLLPTHRRHTYDMLHRQLTALANVWSRTSENQLLDTNHWEARFAEFITDPESAKD